MLTVGAIGAEHPSLAGMLQSVSAAISRQALHYRFGASAVAFLKECLLHLQMYESEVPKPEIECLKHFGHVRIFDSSSWDIAPGLAAAFPGSGGSASAAACKVQAQYDYTTAELTLLDITAGNKNDQSYSSKLTESLAPGDLALFDKGYFRLKTFRAIDKKGAYFLTRLTASVSLYDIKTSKKIDIIAVLKKSQSNYNYMRVSMGKEKDNSFEARLICLRVPEQEANQRRRKLHKEASKKGRTISPKSLALCDWTILVTNAPDEILAPEYAFSIYRIRWQIELLFKQLKSILRIHHCDSRNKHRVLCEVYGKLIMAVLINRIHAVNNIELWNNSKRELSFDKLYKRIQERAFSWLSLLLHFPRKALRDIRAEINRLCNSCLKLYQKSRPTSLQILVTVPNFSFQEISSDALT